MTHKETPFFSGQNQDAIQLRNRSLALQLLKLNGTMSRKELAARTGLNASTVTYIIKDLLEMGLVVETGCYARHGAIGLALDPDGRYVIGLQLARDHLSGGLFNLETRLLASERVPLSPALPVAEVLRRLEELAARLLEQSPERRKVAALGVAAPGPLNLDDGRVAFISNFTGWRDIPIAAALRERFGLPVVVEHDAHAAASAEQWLGSGRTVRNLLYIAAGKGVGAGIIIDGRIYHGAHGMAGEIGHTMIDPDGPRCECGNFGCLEGYCSSTALLRQAEARLAAAGGDSLLAAARPLSFPDLVRAARAADPLALELVREAARYLGAAVVNLINTLEPELVILGDELLELGPVWFETVRATARERLLPEIARQVRIEPASLAGDPFLIGTGAIAIEYLLRHPG
ncbi:glucokinase-like ROK family protein [Hydrogenispora ethanolica]|uniref:Glucokinase-like ROK family protein n=1 Tax=Hydrogenispora ethanolica TaxID=1082276 RepID=A0A4R1S4K8_HYDET|nr:ROK family transcriptional regulator [Hydrogenispora ethanolica]TCL74148.1 glucokinase-like ROK family protein [Hydrogenispora ethanolica]